MAANGIEIAGTTYQAVARYGGYELFTEGGFSPKFANNKNAESIEALASMFDGTVVEFTPVDRRKRDIPTGKTECPRCSGTGAFGPSTYAAGVCLRCKGKGWVR